MITIDKRLKSKCNCERFAVTYYEAEYDAAIELIIDAIYYKGFPGSHVDPPEAAGWEVDSAEPTDDHYEGYVAEQMDCIVEQFELAMDECDEPYR